MTRIKIAALTLSAAAFTGLVVHEGYVDKAMIPTEGDRPTIGFGSTYKEDGSPVRLGETITVQKALSRSLGHIAKDEAGLKHCVTAPMSQAEYDILIDFTYQYGVKAACKSSMVKFTNEGKYIDACNAYTRYRFAAGYDCSTTINGKPNRRCWGLWQRSLERTNKCLGAQNGSIG